MKNPVIELTGFFYALVYEKEVIISCSLRLYIY